MLLGLASSHRLPGSRCAAGTSRGGTCICPMQVGGHAFGNMPAAPKIQASDARASRIIIKPSHAVKVVAL